jgi:hypothetical protein
MTGQDDIITIGDVATALGGPSAASVLQQFTARQGSMGLHEFVRFFVFFGFGHVTAKTIGEITDEAGRIRDWVILDPVAPAFAGMLREPGKSLLTLSETPGTFAVVGEVSPVIVEFDAVSDMFWIDGEAVKSMKKVLEVIHQRDSVFCWSELSTFLPSDSLLE